MTDGLIPAATILLMRDHPQFEVLMIERHADISFAGGALVFPGGKIDPGDRLAGWADHCDGLNSIPEEQHAPRIASIREAFEEAGILIARDPSGAMLDDDRTAALNDWRGKIEQDDALFLELVQQEGLKLACDLLHLYARWQPPKGATHRRYQTWFFAARAPEDQSAREDGNEATEVLWTAPGAALAARDNGERKMIFPTARNVELLNLSNSVGEVFDFAKKRKIEPIEPTLIKRGEEAFITIPDGLGYPVLEEPLTTAFRT